MSISYSAAVVCGFKIDFRGVKEEKTKYNPDTGDPIKVMEHSYDEILVGNVVVANMENPDTGYYGKLDGLDFGDSGFGGEGQRWLGITMATVYDDEPFTEIRRNTPEEVQAFAIKYQLVPKWFLVMSFG